MTWTSAEAALLTAFARAYPVPLQQAGEPLEAHQDRCRAWMRQLGEQFRYTFGVGWGRKRADPGRPWSKDNLPFRGGGVFTGWDVLLGTGTGQPRLNADAPAQYDLTGQDFQGLDPVNWLGGTPEPPDPPDPPVGLEARVVALERAVADLEAWNRQTFKGW